MTGPSRSDLLLGASAFAGTLFFFIPFHLFLLNRDAFFTSTPALAGLLLALSCVIFIFLCLPLFLMRGPVRGVAYALLTFCSIAAWMQAHLLNWDYGVLDGSALRWRLFEYRSVVDALSWGLLLGIVLFLGVKKHDWFRTLLLMLVFIQSGNLLFTWATTTTLSPDSETADFSISFQNHVAFSAEKNIIMLVLDAYQSDIFNQYLEATPDYKDKLTGFRYYPDAITEYQYTLRSIATLLTGELLAPSTYSDTRAQRAHRNALLMERSIPALLKQANYHVGLYPYYAPNVYGPALFGAIADNYVRATVLWQDGGNESVRLLTLALFRSAPHAFKNSIHRYFLLDTSHEQDRDALARDMQRLGRIGITGPAFKYYHLQGLHGPHVIDGIRLDAEERDSALQIAHQVNTMIAEFADRLKQLNVYDNTSILIVADHGLYHDSHRIEYGRFEIESDDNTHALDDFVKKCRALPLILYKPAGATGPLVTDLSPVSLLDMMPTVLNIANIEAPHLFEGIPLLREPKCTQRLRRHWVSDIHRNRSQVPFYEFLTGGFSWHDASWVYTGNLHSSGAIDRVPLNNYQRGTLLTFGQFGSAMQYLDEHWVPENDFHRTNAATATLSLPVADPAATMTLYLDVAYHDTHDDAEAAAVSIAVNDADMGTFTVGGRMTLVLDIPSNPDWEGVSVPDDTALSDDDIWAWSPEPPILSDAVLEVRLQVSPGASNRTDAALHVYSMGLDVVL